jgi:2-polyprenyl-6-methoxyphenol hydroxylase-like FAD-dependent oxidoreductase
MPRDTTRRKCGTGEALRIGVVGAGISGLTFAAAMRRLSPATNVELYELMRAPLVAAKATVSVSRAMPD